MKFIPYHQIDKPEYLVIQMNNQNLVMLESYSTEGDFNKVSITFALLDEQRRVSTHLVEFKVKLNTGEVFEKNVLDTSVDADIIVKDFQDHFYQFKDHLNRHSRVVQEKLTQNPKTLPRDVMELIDGNNCVPYHKIFITDDYMTLNFEKQNYIIKDQYCMKPTCSCDEAIVVVYEENASQSELLFRLDLKDDHYEILKHNTMNDYDGLIIDIIIHHKDTLKARYDKMKEVGKRYLS